MQENVKQVIVKMTARRCFRTEPIFQYDVGHELVFEGFELPAAFEVHFSLSPMGKSITQVGQNGVCVLPDMYAQTAAPIYAWLYIADTDTGLTKYSIEIPVQRRAKPTDQQPTPVEQSAIDQAIAALNAGVERSETAADAAESAQEAAEGYAESAEQSAITATNAASAAASAKTAAETAARNAATSATDAHTSREAADQSATNAGVSERAAASSASAAAGSATSAASSAGQASGSATAASGSASTASTKASEAAQSATAAAGSAASASEDAGTASTAATDAEASATAAAGSATAAAGSATSAGQSATAAAGSAAAAQEVLESIPEDYTELTEDVDSLKSALNGMTTATAEDEGKALFVKTVEEGKVTAWEFLTAGITCTDDGEGNITIHIGNGGGGEVGFNILPYVGGLTSLFQDCVCPKNVTLDFEGNTTLTGLASLGFRCSGLKNLTIKNLTSTKTTVGLNGLGYLASDLETITFDNCSIAPASFESLGRSAPKLKTINGELDLTNCSTTNSITYWFSGNTQSPSVIEEFRIKPNSIKHSPGTNFGNSAVISNDSLVSLANGLSPEVTGGVLKLVDTHKTKIASITGTNDDGLFVMSQSGALSLADFITTVKGWTIE